MTVLYAGTEAYPEQVAVIDDGDQPSAANLAPGVEGALNRAAFLYARALVGINGDACQVPIPLAPVLNSSNRFAMSAVASLGLGLLQVDVTDAGYLLIPVVLPVKKARITAVTATVACAAHSGDPVSGGATLPRISLLREDSSQKVTVATVATGTDGSPNKAEYEALHWLSLVPTPIDYESIGDLLYYLAIEGETNGGGSGAEANKLMIKAVAATIEEAP